MSTFLRGDSGNFALFDIELNDEILCTATADQDDDVDLAQATCSAIFFASQGNLKTILHFYQLEKYNYTEMI